MPAAVSRVAGVRVRREASPRETVHGGLFFSFECDARTPGGADVPFIGREREDRDGQLLVLVLFALERAPLEGSLG